LHLRIGLLDQQQRFQRMVYPEGITYERPGRIGTAVTSPVFRYLCAIRGEKKLWYENRARVAPSRRAAAEPRLSSAALRGSRPVGRGLSLTEPAGSGSPNGSELEPDRAVFPRGQGPANGGGVSEERPGLAGSVTPYASQTSIFVPLDHLDERPGDDHRRGGRSHKARRPQPGHSLEDSDVVNRNDVAMV